MYFKKFKKYTQFNKPKNKSKSKNIGGLLQPAPLAMQVAAAPNLGIWGWFQPPQWAVGLLQLPLFFFYFFKL
jgi:hypothetical protein